MAGLPQAAWREKYGERSRRGVATSREAEWVNCFMDKIGAERPSICS